MTATCPSIRAHWRHLANMIELVHPSAHLSPQPKRQMDRFSRFSTAYDRERVYFAMGAPVHQNCAFPCGIWTSHVTRCFQSMRVHNPNGTSIGSVTFAQMTVACLYFTMVCLFPPSKLPLPMWASGPHVIRGSLGPPESRTQMAT